MKLNKLIGKNHHEPKGRLHYLYQAKTTLKSTACLNRGVNLQNEKTTFTKRNVSDHYLTLGLRNMGAIQNYSVQLLVRNGALTSEVLAIYTRRSASNDDVFQQI